MSCPVAIDPMLYTVECCYSDSFSEAEWNDFYSLHKLPALVSVNGFQTSQRFRALSAGCPVYLAVHSIDATDVLDQEDYRHKGGGNFSRWQRHITDWHRNIYEGLGRAPEIGPGEHLMLSAIGPDPLVEQGLQPHALHAIALEKCPKQRWLARLPHAGDGDVQSLVASLPPGVHLYRPLTERLVRPAAIAPTTARTHDDD